jgi:hypothetical protein
LWCLAGDVGVDNLLFPTTMLVRVEHLAEVQGFSEAKLQPLPWSLVLLEFFAQYVFSLTVASIYVLGWY